MVPVVLGALTLVGVVFSALAPVLAISARRRLLRLAREEVELLQATEDDEVAAELRESALATAARYRAVATRKESERRTRQAGFTGAALYPLGLAAFVPTFYPQLVFDAGRAQDVFSLVGGAVLGLSLTVPLALLLRAYSALRTEAAESNAVTTAQSQTDEAVSAMVRAADELEGVTLAADDPNYGRLRDAVAKLREATEPDPSYEQRRRGNITNLGSKAAEQFLRNRNAHLPDSAVQNLASLGRDGAAAELARRRRERSDADD